MSDNIRSLFSREQYTHPITYTIGKGKVHVLHHAKLILMFVNGMNVLSENVA